MRRFFVVLLLLVFMNQSFADSLYPDNFKVGKTGDIRQKVLIVDIISEDEMLVMLGDNPTIVFFVTKFPTKGLIDDSYIEIKGTWKCVKTKKHDDKPRIVIEPVK